MKGLFITLEGTEGAGKTTQVKGLTSALEELGYDVLLTREPGGSEMAAKIRAVLLDAANTNLVPMAELFLYLADRAQHVEEMIRPALKEGKAVVCDRYADATIAYQGFARGLGPEKVAQLNHHATSGLQPDLTILFDLPVAVGLTRANRRADQMALFDLPPENRFEREELSFHEAVRQGYLTLARENPGRFELVDATLGVNELAAAIREIVGRRIAKELMQA